jgi:small subunit ribosomal protein S7e
MNPARKKILKDETYTPTDLETSVSNAMVELQANNDSLKTEMADLHILAVREINVTATKKAIIIFVPYRELRAYHRIQARFVRELEKKFSGKNVVVIAQRRVLQKPGA